MDLVALSTMWGLRLLKLAIQALVLAGVITITGLAFLSWLLWLWQHFS